ncbi:variable surface lipoprotein [Mycoplasmopsis bovis]|uniref:variable surface lipoprotein n=1 Tax=Mycoplasmopsis bovis TaxID=28903 RepID=UPI0011536290|nr:variable surface lipoprotein [Mycoplasmopsis bovis]TQF41443.1 hypothetical protein A9K67_00080 [Mycoplasmopsis bovis]
MKKTNKIIISLSSIISISSMPLIAASCENKNPTDEIIINNTTPPKKTIDKQKQEEPNGSGNSSPDTIPQNQDKQKQEDESKEEKNDDPKYLLKQLEEIQEDYKKAKENNEKFKELNYLEDLEFWFKNIPNIGHEWNHYLNFNNQVNRNEKHEYYLKLAKEFMEKYKTKIKKELEEKKLI